MRDHVHVRRAEGEHTGRGARHGGAAEPGLFATGEIAGDFFFHNYAAGSGLMRSAVFGRIASANAARLAAGKSGGRGVVAAPVGEVRR